MPRNIKAWKAKFIFPIFFVRPSLLSPSVRLEIVSLPGAFPLTAALTGILLAVRGSVLFDLAGGDLADHYGGPDHVGGSLLSLRPFRHEISIAQPAPGFILLSRRGQFKLRHYRFFSVFPGLGPFLFFWLARRMLPDDLRVMPIRFVRIHVKRHIMFPVHLNPGGQEGGCHPFLAVVIEKELPARVP